MPTGRKHIFLITLALLPVMAAAQETSSLCPELFAGRAVAGNFCDVSSSANSISIWQMTPEKTVFATGGYEGGDNHLAMESGKIWDAGFTASGGVQLKDINLYGTFSYDWRRHSERAWSDNFYPYNGNPYQTGSYLPGKYSEQQFDYEVKASSRRLWNHLWFGLGHNYFIGDLARLQDPRSRSMKVIAGISPSVSAQFGRHVVNLTYKYTFDRERIDSYVSKALSGKEYYLYLQEGMGVYTQLVSDSYDRRTVCSYNSITLDYSWSSDAVSLFMSPDVTLRKDSIEDRNRQIPGDYSSTALSLRTIVDCKVSPNGLVRLDLDAMYDSGKANRNWSQARTVIDPDTKIAKVVYDILLTLQTYTCEDSRNKLSATYHSLDGNGHSLWYSGLVVGFDYLDNRNIYYQPTSKSTAKSLSLIAKGGGVPLSKSGSRLEISGKAGFRKGLVGEFSFSPSIEGTDIKDNVTLPDYNIRSSDVVLMDFSVTYNFPIIKALNGVAAVSLSDACIPCGVCKGKDRLSAVLRLGVRW